LASKAGQSAPGADRPPSESGPSAPHQEASNDTPTSMEEDDLLGEDLVDLHVVKMTNRSLYEGTILLLTPKPAEPTP
jgi:hypothetical protein